MDPGVLSEFGMEGGRQQIALLNCHWASIIQAGQHVYGRTDANYNGGTNENAIVGIRSQGIDLQWLLEAINLSAEGISLNPYVH